MLEHIIQAHARLKGHSNVTPIKTSRTLNSILDAEIYFKCENYQRIGAFKFRGAFNCISQLSKVDKKRGVIAFSSGNHAQAVALVGKMLGIKTTIIMPSNAPTIKLEATKSYGANIIKYDFENDSREEITSQIQAEHGYALIPPFNHPEIIAGQGTATYEMIEHMGDLDMLLVPCGGGGLLSGSAIAAKGLSPHCKVIGIESELGDDATRSFYSKTLQSIKNSQTIADGTRTPSLGSLTFPLILEHVDEMKTVSEQSIIEAVQFFFYRMKMVVEPSGALGLAALLSKAVKPKGKVGVLISGGNIDSATMKTVLNFKPK